MHREVGSTHSKCASKWVGTRMWRSYILYIQSKLLTSTLTHNFDKITKLSQEWDPLSKAKKSRLFIKMQKN
jgi:hypothetical protein